MIPSRVLDDADVVDEREQVVGAEARQMQVGHAGRVACAARTSNASRRTAAVASATDGQASPEPMRRDSARAAASLSGCSM